MIRTWYFITFERHPLQLKCTWSSVCRKLGFHCRGIINLGLSAGNL